MSISLLLESVTNAIAAISITGVTVKDADEVAASWKSLPNVLYPNPEGFITDFSITYQANLRGATAPLDVAYTLNYRFLGVEIGDLSQMAKQYGDMIGKVADIIAAMISTDTPYSGIVEMEVRSVSIGARADPVGNIYHGADIALGVTEMQNP